jgi:hypothetical protein
MKEIACPSFLCGTEIKKSRGYSSTFLAGDRYYSRFQTNLKLEQQQLVAGIHKYCMQPSHSCRKRGRNFKIKMHFRIPIVSVEGEDVVCGKNWKGASGRAPAVLAKLLYLLPIQRLFLQDFAGRFEKFTKGKKRSSIM